MNLISSETSALSPWVGVRVLCSKIRELCYALMLTILCSIKRPLCSIGTPLSSAMLIFRHRTERSAAFSREIRPSGSALVLLELELSEASCCESSLSLETVVNVADARLLDEELYTTWHLVVIGYIHAHVFYASRENRACAFFSLGVTHTVCIYKCTYT